MLNEQLKEEIKAEAIKYESATQHDGLGPALYIEGANKYASQWQEEKELRERYEKALKIIQTWQLPPTGQFWYDDKTRPMSYAACYGSNGERDFMRNVANEALTHKTSTDE